MLGETVFAAVHPACEIGSDWPVLDCIWAMFHLAIYKHGSLSLDVSSSTFGFYAWLSPITQ